MPELAVMACARRSVKGSAAAQRARDAGKGNGLVRAGDPTRRVSRFMSVNQARFRVAAMAESFFATLECELLDRTTLSTKPRFGDAADRHAFILDLHALHLMPQRRTVIYATRNPADALEVANWIAVLRRGRIVQCGTPSEIHRAPVSRFVARLFH